MCIDAPFQVEPKIKLKSAKKKDTVVKLRQWWEPLPGQRQLDLNDSLRYLKGEIKDKVRCGDFVLCWFELVSRGLSMVFLGSLR